MPSASRESLDQCLLDRLQIRKIIAEQFFERDTRSAAESSLRLASLLSGIFRHLNHVLRIHIYEHCALVDEDIAVEEAAGAADFSPVDFDIIAWPELRIDAQFAKPLAAALQISLARSGNAAYPATRG